MAGILQDSGAAVRSSTNLVAGEMIEPAFNETKPCK